jgi:hypothetical protein
MPASFQELFLAAGVDENKKPNPGMVVPLGGSNVVRLANGTGLRLEAPRTLKVEELRSYQGAVLALASLSINFMGLMKPGAVADARYFCISGKTPIGPTPAQVKAVKPGRSNPEAVLDVVVLRQKKVKLSIRPVQVRGPQGGLVFHSKEPFDVNKMVGEMNFIWTPQANVAFQVVSSDPVQVTDGAEIAKILDLQMTKDAPLPAMVVLQKFSGMFNRLKDQNAKMTMFLVERVGNQDGPLSHNASPVLGLSDPQLGIALISDARTRHREIMAHEAGHILGSFVGQGGKFMNFGHKGGTDALMHDGGSEIAKIPFEDVISFFNPP